MSQVLQNTEASHRLSIHLLTNIVSYALRLDEPWRSALIEPTLDLVDLGDRIGHGILTYFESVVRNELQ